MHSDGSWQFWIDRGGTFTDVVALCPDGTLSASKLLSDNAGQYVDAAAEGIRRELDRWRRDGNARAPVEAVKMGTTVATNALLERQGSATALVVTQGFADAIEIGYQNRPDIFALNIRKPGALYSQVIEAKERIDALGNVIAPLEEADLLRALQSLHNDGIRSVAICLMHGYCYPQHEQQAAAIARGMGFDQVSVSHELEPLIKLISRAQTTLADAYLTPVLNSYIARLQHALAKIDTPRRLLFMQSSGGLALASNFRGKDSVLSGPAAGVVGMVETATAAGLDKLIGFDMGGTSTDVSAYSGEYERSNDSEVAGVRLRAPMMKIHTIAAGGGSHLHYTDQRFQVGPDSAGANPGPASYRLGGPLTVTDANILLGRIPVEHFPRVFGKNGKQALDSETVTAKFDELAQTISQDRAQSTKTEDVAAGFLVVAVESMANAIRKITIEQGEDVRDFTLCCFGGAGGQHACQVAEALGISTVWIHPLAGVLSAYGMGLADIRVQKQQSLEMPLKDDSISEAEVVVAALRGQCRASLRQQNVPSDAIRLRVRAGIRVAASDSILSVDFADAASMARDFGASYRARFGAEHGSNRLVIATIEVEGDGVEQRFEDPIIAEGEPPSPVATSRVWMEDRWWYDVPVFDRESLSSGARVSGPAIVSEKNATTVIDPGWSGTINNRGHLKLARKTAEVPAVAEHVHAGKPDPVRLEVFNRLFMHIAEQMGTVLQNTALSVNIRERLDFSCALFDAEGRLVSNAPHMPVHLGSMGESVRSVIRDRGRDLRDGDAVMLNSPYNGGTHLPDITVVTPWFEDSRRPIFYLASRAHHADIGGITPGSMPSGSQHIDEEGVLIDNFLLVSQGEFQHEAVVLLLESAKYPARNIAQNVADLKAQMAANQQGIRQLLKAVDRYGLETVQNYLRFVRENAASSVQRLLGTLKDGSFRYELDSGESISVSIRVDHDIREAYIDFAGTSPQSRSNFNAPQAVTRAAVLYVFRSLINEQIPMNEGCLEPLHINIPDTSLLSPVYPAPVVAGNVETSQCVTDALYGALGVLAASQGTMNNLTFGNDQLQYYETICGGAGAGDGFDGADAVHTHMTNSRLTDPEVLERKFPVVLESFSIRTGSGGEGRWHGGNGTVRKLRFLEAIDASILSNHRRIAPFGAHGGEAGAAGQNLVERASGDIELLGGTATLSLQPGDALVIKTPGGGGFGKP